MTSPHSNIQPRMAAIYCRVSSKRQAKKGDGLGSQETRCREFAGNKGYEEAAVFLDEGVSGGMTDRPAMKEMLKWLRKNRQHNPMALIDDISRFARGIEAHLSLRAAIGSVGASLESPSIEFGEDSDSQLIENMLASVSQHHRQKNAEQVRHRMKARLTNGYYTFWVPLGYRYEAAPGQGKVLVQDEPHASLLKDALEGFANGRFQTQPEVKRFLETHAIFSRDAKGHIHPQRIKNLLTNPIYAGYYEHKPWGVPLTKGRHDPLISYETFQRIQERLRETAPAPERPDLNEDFPLRGFVTCASCDSAMTGYWAKGRNKRYAYYECFNKSCDQHRKTIAKSKLEGEFETLLRQLRPSAVLMKATAATLRDIWDRRAETLTSQKTKQRKALTALDAHITRLTDRLIATDSPATIQAYEAKLEKMDSECVLIHENLSQKARGKADFDATFRTAMEFLANPWKLWESHKLEDRRSVLRLVFAAPLPYA